MTIPRTVRSASLAIVWTIWAIAPAQGQAPPPPPPAAVVPPAIDQQIQNDRPQFFIRVWVDRENRTYTEGEPLTLKVRSEEDAFLYVLYQQADGKIFQIFPNSGQPDNRIKARQDLTVPGLDDGFRWVIGAPFGNEVVKVIASKMPIDALSLPGLRVARFNPITSDQVEGVGQGLAKEANSVWSEHDLAIQTVPRSAPIPPADAGPKRFGAFFGVSKYQYDDDVFRLTKKKLSLNAPSRDAQSMSDALKEAGGLNDLRIYQDARATRAAMKQAITVWLPSVSRPGDTVFLYFSGHGTQIADDTNEEEDGKDEVLMTYDFLPLSVFDDMLGRKTAGTLPADQSKTVDRYAPEITRLYRQIVGADRHNEKKLERYFDVASAYLSRVTAVDDDEMGHWVQKLDGRQVVVILDACRSAGMAGDGKNQVKDLRGADRKPLPDFDFLKAGFSRLKDLNQPSLTVLSACAETENSLDGPENSLFTQPPHVVDPDHGRPDGSA